MIDLAESKRVKDAIESNPEGVKDVLADTPLAVCITNKDRNFDIVNQNYCQLYGYTEDELVGKAFTIVVPDENKEMMEMLHDKFLVDKREIARSWEVQDKNGNRIKIEVDAGYTEKLPGGPHKITLIQKS